MKQPLIEFDKITQGQLEAYMRSFRELGGKDENIGLVEYAGAMVRAAVKVGLLELDVDNAGPKEIQAIHKSIQEYVKDVLEYDSKN
jgi:hypothetical protein